MCGALYGYAWEWEMGERSLEVVLHCILHGVWDGMLRIRVNQDIVFPVCILLGCMRCLS